MDKLTLFQTRLSVSDGGPCESAPKKRTPLDALTLVSCPRRSQIVERLEEPTLTELKTFAFAEGCRYMRVFCSPEFWLNERKPLLLFIFVRTRFNVRIVSMCVHDGSKLLRSKLKCEINEFYSSNILRKANLSCFDGECASVQTLKGAQINLSL